MNLNEFKNEFRLVHDKYDPWGEAMSAFFELAAQMFIRGLNIPSEWQYSPGMTNDPSEPENYWHELFRDSSDEDLLEIGILLHRLTGILERAGKSY